MITKEELLKELERLLKIVEEDEKNKELKKDSSHWQNFIKACTTFSNNYHDLIMSKMITGRDTIFTENELDKLERLGGKRFLAVYYQWLATEVTPPTNAQTSPGKEEKNSASNNAQHTTSAPMETKFNYAEHHAFIKNIKSWNPESKDSPNIWQLALQAKTIDEIIPSGPFAGMKLITFAAINGNPKLMQTVLEKPGDLFQTVDNSLKILTPLCGSSIAMLCVNSHGDLESLKLIFSKLDETNSLKLCLTKSSGGDFKDIDTLMLAARIGSLDGVRFLLPYICKPALVNDHSSDISQSIGIATMCAIDGYIAYITNPSKDPIIHQEIITRYKNIILVLSAGLKKMTLEKPEFRSVILNMYFVVLDYAIQKPVPEMVQTLLSAAPDNCLHQISAIRENLPLCENDKHIAIANALDAFIVTQGNKVLLQNMLGINPAPKKAPSTPAAQPPAQPSASSNSQADLTRSSPSIAQPALAGDSPLNAGKKRPLPDDAGNANKQHAAKRVKTENGAAEMPAAHSPQRQTPMEVVKPRV